MSSRALPMNAATVVFAAEKPNAKIKPSLLIVDNERGAAQRQITLQDRFTPSASNAVPAPVVTTVNRLIITVDNGSFAVAGPEIENVEILGQLEALIDVVDANCIVTIAWDFN
jgi:hypothetical protein